MTNNQLAKLIHPTDGQKVDGGYRLRLALYQLVIEVAPDSDDAFVAIDGELDLSAVRFQSPPPRTRWPGWPRAFEARSRLAAIVANVYPDVRRAGAVFKRNGVTIGVLELPLARALT